MALYAGLPPQAALQLWYQNRQKYGPDGSGATTPEEQNDYAGNLSTLQQENPQAWQLLQTGQNDNGTTRQIFNPDTGSWDNQDVKGYWSNPESWIQLAAGAGLGGVSAANLIGSGTQAAASGAATGGTGAATGGTAAGIGGSVTGALKGFASDPKNWLSLASDLTANAAGRAAGRAQEGYLNQGADRNAISLYQALLANNAAQNQFGLSRGALANQNAATDLNQREFALQAPQMRARTAVRGDILANAQDATVSGISPNIPVPTINGGLRPSMFSPATRDLGGIMSTQARDQQAKGDTFAPPPDLPTWQAPPKPPTLMGNPQSNFLDSALTTGGNLLNIGGRFADFLKKYRQGAGANDGSTSDVTTGVYS